MKNYLVLSLLFAGTLALPCAAAVKDTAAAMTALNSAVAKDRLDAIYFLGAQRSTEAYAALAAHFPSEKDAYLRVQLVDTLNVEGSTWAYVCAADAAGDANRAVRRAAARALAVKAGDPAADIKLKALATDPVEAVRAEVVNSLSVGTSTSAVSIIGGVLSDEKGTLRVRRAAAAALSKMKTAQADAELFKHASDADPEIKAAAASRKASGGKPEKPAKPAKPVKK
jgi:hypothetical protein